MSVGEKSTVTIEARGAYGAKGVPEVLFPPCLPLFFLLSPSSRSSSAALRLEASGVVTWPELGDAGGHSSQRQSHLR
eukprot:318742-Rhodomonas_salina.1